MSTTADPKLRYCYCVAAFVGACFGLLVGGAAVFVSHVERPAPTVHWTPVAAAR